MKLSKIYLSNFRNFEEKLIEFSDRTTVFIGDNAVGKTNILESIYLLSLGKSFKATKEEEMINYNVEIARVKGLLEKDGESYKPEIVLTRGYITIDEESGKKEKVGRKRLLLNGVGKRLVDFSGNFKSVLFSPQDMDLVTESPSIRRKFLDNVLFQVDREYRRSLISYNKGLRRRNKVLKKIRDEGAPRSQLLFWDKLLIKNGDYIVNKREEFIDFANSQDIKIDKNYSILYDKSGISEARLKKYSNEEVAAATTLVGPHRDDFIFKMKKDDTSEDELALYGSRGEQRMGVLWLKLSEVIFIEDQTKEKPLLLLDDIFSELDSEHREIVLNISKNQQTVITTADSQFVEGMSGVEKIEISG